MASCPGGRWPANGGLRRPTSITGWNSRIGLSDEEELLEVEEVLQRSAPAAETQEIRLAELLLAELVAVPLQARTRNSVMTHMVELAARSGLLWDPEKMVEAVRQREDMAPTALENGVALLHPRRPMARILSQPLLALGVTRTGIPFGGRSPMTDVFFLVCSMDDRGHLRTLARLSRVLNQPGLIEGLRQSPDAATARQLILDAEGTWNCEDDPCRKSRSSWWATPIGPSFAAHAASWMRWAGYWPSPMPRRPPRSWPKGNRRPT